MSQRLEKWISRLNSRRQAYAGLYWLLDLIDVLDIVQCSDNLKRILILPLTLYCWRLLAYHKCRLEYRILHCTISNMHCTYCLPFFTSLLFSSLSCSYTSSSPDISMIGCLSSCIKISLLHSIRSTMLFIGRRNGIKTSTMAPVAEHERSIVH
jgi:hypothetical protein